VWVQWEKEGPPLSPTPENTSNSSDNNCGRGWSSCENEEEEAPLAPGAKGKEVVVQSMPTTTRADISPASALGVAPAGEGTTSRGVPDLGGAPLLSASKKHKRPVATQW
jgi:hypothetical protein